MKKILTWFNHWTKIVTALLGFLVVIPSVINSFTDIYVAWQGLPIGEKEKINSRLFQSHFQENPQHSHQLMIDGSSGQWPMTVDVFNNGDVFINYGQNVQWFPYKQLKISDAGFSFIKSAHASWYVEPQNANPAEKVDADSVKIESRYISKTEIERIRYLSDGSSIKQVININTGRVISTEYIPAE